ncbi:MAG: Crp/Fnr family transcriptional regulator [Terriglobales bacterium]
MRTQAQCRIELVDDCAKCPLRKKGYFCQMADDSIAAFAKVKCTTSYPAGAVLFVEGQVPRGVYMLCHGQVKLTTGSSEGKTVMRVAEAGELLGLHSAISGEPHELRAETLQTCQVDFVRRDDFLKLLREQRDIMVNTMRQFSDDYRHTFQQIRYLALIGSATEKLAGFLLDSSARGHKTPQGIRFTLNLTHEEIAQVVGVRRETVTRGLAELRERSLISTVGPTILIPNKQALAAIIA